jgi:nucleoside 2-deoxyribosyltransferase
MSMAVAKTREPSREGAPDRAAVRCFVAARSTTDTEPIRALLTARGITPVLAHEAPAPGLTVADAITSLISGSDMVLALLDRDDSTGDSAATNVAFELGYAFAFNKKILMVAPPEADIPAAISALFCIRASFDDTEAVSFALDQLLAAPVPTSRPQRSPERVGRPIGAFAEQLLDRLDSEHAQADGQALEQLVIEAVLASGASVATPLPEDNGDHADIAVWSDDLEPWVGNPLLIQVKGHIKGERDAAVARSVLMSSAEQGRGGLAIVLYGGGPSPEDAAAFSSPSVLFMGLRDFLERLRSHRLVDVILPVRDAARRRPA